MTTTEISYTNTALATARRCLTEFDLRYLQRLERDGVESEALQVGQAWHKAFEHMETAALEAGEPSDNFRSIGYGAINAAAPSPLWAEKLRRLFAAYHWYWRDEPFEFEKVEHSFAFELDGRLFRGQYDGKIKLDGQVGLLERKTAGESIGTESAYWNRLTMGVQVGLYGLAFPEFPAFILYDVVRKPTINPKALPKKVIDRFRAELAENGAATYYGETFGEELIQHAIQSDEEPLELYGARLTADIGDRPGYYFQRRPVPRTAQDYATLVASLKDQVDLLEWARSNSKLHRNPDSCASFGTCSFFALCSNNIRPAVGDAPPEGYHQREHLHPELA